MNCKLRIDQIRHMEQIIVHKWGYSALRHIRIYYLRDRLLFTPLNNKTLRKMADNLKTSSRMYHEYLDAYIG